MSWAAATPCNVLESLNASGVFSMLCPPVPARKCPIGRRTLCHWTTSALEIQMRPRGKLLIHATSRITWISFSASLLANYTVLPGLVGAVSVSRYRPNSRIRPILYVVWDIFNGFSPGMAWAVRIPFVELDASRVASTPVGWGRL